MLRKSKLFEMMKHYSTAFKRSALIGIMLFFITGIYGQTDSTTTEPEASPDLSKAQMDTLVKKKNAIGFNFGLQGLGLDYGRRLNDHFQMRLRGQALPFTLDDYEITVSDQDVNVDFELNITNIGIIVDYHPFVGKSFKLMFGGSYFLENRIEATVRLRDSLFFGDDGPDPDTKGDFVFTPEDIGTVTGRLEWAEFAPYMGLGFGRAVPKNAIGFSIELGAYYMGEPDVSIKATGMLEDTAEEEDELESNLSDLKWLPQLNFRLSFRF